MLALVSRQSVFICFLTVFSSAYADIYLYIDDAGEKHFLNYFQEGATLVKKLSPLQASQPYNIDVQTLLDNPRFNTKVTMSQQQLQGYQKNFPNRFLLNSGLLYATEFSPEHKLLSGKLYTEFMGRAIFSPYINQIASEVGVPAPLVHAVISVESAFNPNARSHAGAQGLMQLMPFTAKRFGVEDSFDPIDNIRGGTIYLKFLLEKFKDVELALAGYNAGENAVVRHGYNIPPYKETQNYVPRVMAYYYLYLQQNQ